ncbi:MAG: hypothetical protein HC786_23870 [Richelia sp. CSU_2_1]|nr:hypothetical protein [Richelia sp. CSU_2_1]
MRQEIFDELQTFAGKLQEFAPAVRQAVALIEALTQENQTLRGEEALEDTQDATDRTAILSSLRSFNSILSDMDRAFDSVGIGMQPPAPVAESAPIAEPTPIVEPAPTTEPNLETDPSETSVLEN